MYVSKREHCVKVLDAPAYLQSLLAAGADVAAASQAYPTPLDLMLFWNGQSWLQWENNAAAVTMLVR